MGGFAFRAGSLPHVAVLFLLSLSALLLSMSVGQTRLPPVPRLAAPYRSAQHVPAPVVSTARAPERHVARVVRAAPLTVATSTLHFPAPPIRARAAILLDMRTGAVLYRKDADARLPMASTTKITTALVTLRSGHLNDLARVSRRAASVGQSTMVLRRGERVRVRDLLYGLLLNSANDASIALAEHVAGSVPRFVARMNALARRLGMTHTHYVTPHGLDRPGHYTSARDLAMVARVAMRNPLFRRIVATPNYYIAPTRHNRAHWLANINYPLYWFPGVEGVKPGDTTRAGLCQVVAARRGGRELLAVLLNTPNLVTDVRTLLDFGSRDFSWVQAPAWWDQPTSFLTGGLGNAAWRYYSGAGHYVRGVFLRSYLRYGGLATLGLPRTEELRDGGKWVQFFQGGELAYLPRRGTVVPEPLGLDLARRWAGRPPATRPLRVARPFRRLYRSLGGRRVLGPPITRFTRSHGVRAQFFRSAALVQIGGAPSVMPLGDAELRLRGLLPVAGTGNVHPPTIAPAAALWARPARTGKVRPRPASANRARR